MIAHSPGSRLLNIFRLGVLIKNNQTLIGLPAVAEITDLTDREISLMLEMAATFNDCETDFKTFIIDNGIESWEEYQSHLRGPSIEEIAPEEILRAARDMSYNIQKSILHNRSELLDAYRILRDAINRVLPPQTELFDREFLRYYQCGCCGNDAPVEGNQTYPHELYPHLNVPICKDCKSLSQPINWELVAGMYASYANNTEEAFYNLHGL